MRNDFSPVLELTLRQALAYLDQLDKAPVGPTASAGELRSRICKQWNAERLDASQVVNDLVHDIAGGLNNSANARFYAWVIWGSLPSALLAGSPRPGIKTPACMQSALPRQSWRRQSVHG